VNTVDTLRDLVIVAIRARSVRSERQQV